jgi:CheY-like chemotaxis protein
MDQSHDSDRSSTAGVRRVLYVDDNPTNIKLVAAIFSSRPDIELVTAGNAHDAMSRALGTPPDLVLLDLNLPDAPGDALLRNMNGDSRIASVPKVIVSAEDDGHVKERALAAGADAYMTKPFDLESFLGVVDRFLE